MGVDNGVGYTFDNLGQSSSLVVDTGRASVRGPGQVYASGTNKFKVMPFLVNGCIPKMSGAYLDSASTPELTCSSSGIVYISVEKVTKNPFPKSVELQFMSGSTAPEDTTDKGYMILASITKGSNGTITISQYWLGCLVVIRTKNGQEPALYFWQNL